jgi:hypothetical protein
MLKSLKWIKEMKRKFAGGFLHGGLSCKRIAKRIAKTAHAFV